LFGFAPRLMPYVSRGCVRQSQARGVNFTVAVTIIVLIFTNTKIMKYLRHQMQQWDALHDTSKETLAYETVDDVGEENGVAHCNILKLLNRLRLYVYSVDQGH